MSDRLPSTGRKPSMSPERIQALLEAYYGEDSPSLEELCERFPVTNSKGESRSLSLATVRKYLKAAGIELPRGKAAVKERAEGRKAPCSVRTMMNRIPTEVLLGDGQTKLLVRLLERGESQKGLAAQFGISERRVRSLRASLVSVEESAEEAPEAVEAASEPTAEVESAPESAEVPEETVEA